MSFSGQNDLCFTTNPNKKSNNCHELRTKSSVITYVDLPFFIAISGVGDCVLGASTADIGTIIVTLVAFRSSTND